MKLEWINQGSNDTRRELFPSRNVPGGRRDRDTGKITVTGKLYTVRREPWSAYKTLLSLSSGNVRFRRKSSNNIIYFGEVAKLPRFDGTAHV